MYRNFVFGTIAFSVSSSLLLAILCIALSGIPSLLWNQGHERWGNGAGLEELASALESDMRDSAATSHSRISSPMTTSWPCSHPLCVRVCVHTCVCVCVICISLISLEPSNYSLTRFPSFSFNCISIFKEPSTVATLHFITSLSKCLALIRP